MSHEAPIVAEYKPKEWEALIRNVYEKQYNESVDLLQKIQQVTEDEAEKMLMLVMMKASVIDRFLAIFGEQTAEALYDKINESIGNEENPFKSASDLDEFATCMSPMFVATKPNHKYRNTGYGYRLFCQYIKTRCEVGDEVNEDTFNDVLEDFYKTIQVECSINLSAQRRLIFKKREILLDFVNLRHFAKRIEGFSYDGFTLKFASETENFSLILPVLAYTVDTDHPRRLDKSRQVSGLLFIGKKSSGLDSAVFYFHGHVAPNSCEPIDVYQFWEFEKSPVRKTT